MNHALASTSASLRPGSGSLAYGAVGADSRHAGLRLCIPPQRGRSH